MLSVEDIDVGHVVVGSVSLSANDLACVLYDAQRQRPDGNVAKSSASVVCSVQCVFEFKCVISPFIKT